MWPQWVQKLTGSEKGATTTERLLREQNDLMRLLLKQQGLKELPPRVGVGAIGRKRTEADVTHMTRASLAAHQATQREAQRMAELNDRATLGTPSPSESEPS